MQDPEKLKAALARAADPNSVKKEESRRSSSGDAPSEEDDEDKALHGGEVKICLGCITRERKRAARKKVKKVDEEESWHQDEHKRVIVFNTQEMKDWLPPSYANVAEEVGDRTPPIVPEGALQVDVPMRIACYCRHHNEKQGFQ